MSTVTKTNDLEANLLPFSSPYIAELQYYSDQKIVSSYKASNQIHYITSKTKTTQYTLVEEGNYTQFCKRKDDTVNIFLTSSDTQCQLKSDKVKKYEKFELNKPNIYKQMFDLSHNTTLFQTLNSNGKEVLDNISNLANNAKTPSIYIIYFGKQKDKDTWYVPLIYKIDNLSKFKNNKKEQEKTQTITIPCPSYDIAKVVYYKQFYQYCKDNDGNKTLIYDKRQTSTADLEISKELEALKEKLGQLNAEKAKAQDLLDRLNKLYKEKEDEYIGGSEELKQLKQQQQQANQYFNQCVKESNAIFAQLQATWKQRDKQEANAKSYQNQIDSLYNSTGTVLTTEEGQKLRQLYDKRDEANKKAEQLQNKSEQLGKQQDEIHKKFDQAYKELQEIDKLVEQAQKKEEKLNQQLRNELNDLNEQINKQQESIDKINGDISDVQDKINALEKDLNDYDIKEMLGLKDESTDTTETYYSIYYHVDSRDLTKQNYQEQLKKYNKALQDCKSSDYQWKHQDGADACKKKCKDPGCFSLGTGQSNNAAFMAQLQAKAAEYKKKYPAKDYNSVIRQTEGNSSYNDQNSIGSYDYQSHFNICFTCKNKYLSK